MSTDPIRGKTIRFTFSDGPMAEKTFEHVFDSRGTVRFRMTDGGGTSSEGKKNKGDDAGAPERNYEVAMVGDVGAVSYTASGGYTLTTLLDFKTKKLAAFSSNEKGVSVQHGTFEYGEAGPSAGR